MPIHVFAGPTISRAEVNALCRDAIVHPPIQHGDLFALGLRPGDTAVIIDGFFHHSAPVRHKEILKAIDDGVSVAGSSSMGALRAAELDTYGMKGVGVVYKWYRDGEIEADDEVALAHEGGGTYRPLSEPLVNIRYLVRRLEHEGLLNLSQQCDIMNLAKSIAYPERSWARLLHAAKGRPVEEALNIVTRELRSRPLLGNVKLQDAQLALRIARVGFKAEQKRVGSLGGSQQWFTPRLWEWQANFQRTIDPSSSVNDVSIVNFVQIYDGDFAERWRTYVLRKISSLAGSTEGLEADAIKAAKAAGISVEALSEPQLANWLSSDETRLAEREKLLRVLVRSSRLVPALAIAGEPAARQLLLTNVQTITQDVVEAGRRNSEYARRGLSYSALKTKVIHEHLARIWGVSSDDLNFAAFDRGFPSLKHAVSAAKPFFLFHEILES